jgi:hypothetical protein
MDSKSDTVIESPTSVSNTVSVCEQFFQFPSRGSYKDISMSGTSASPQLAERQDIHKSCRTLETLVNMLNDYSEAAGAIVALQKKLSKALKEAAALKTTTEIAGKLVVAHTVGRFHETCVANALSTSASIFDVLTDVDAKFAKITDKECSAVSSEVKKWFKKLTVRSFLSPFSTSCSLND